MPAKALSRDIFIVAAKRTPFGTFGGKLTRLSAIDLGVVAAKAALQAGKVDPSTIDHVVFGNVAQTSADAIYMARHVGLKSGVPIPVPDELVETVRERAGADNTGRIASRFKPGDRVRIDRGPFAGLEAAFDRRTSASGRSRVLVNLLSRTVPVEISESELTQSRG